MATPGRIDPPGPFSLGSWHRFQDWRNHSPGNEPLPTFQVAWQEAEAALLGSPDPEERLGSGRPEFTAGFTVRSWKCPLDTATNNYPPRMQQPSDCGPFQTTAVNPVTWVLSVISQGTEELCFHYTVVY